jgi:hypothetical protein
LSYIEINVDDITENNKSISNLSKKISSNIDKILGENDESNLNYLTINQSNQNMTHSSLGILGSSPRTSKHSNYSNN